MDNHNKQSDTPSPSQHVTPPDVLSAVGELLNAYAKKYRLERGGLREARPFKNEFGKLWVAYNDYLCAHLRVPPPQIRVDVE